MKNSRKIEAQPPTKKWVEKKVTNREKKGWGRTARKKKGPASRPRKEQGWGVAVPVGRRGDIKTSGIGALGLKQEQFRAKQANVKGLRKKKKSSRTFWVGKKGRGVFQKATAKAPPLVQHRKKSAETLVISCKSGSQRKKTTRNQSRGDYDRLWKHVGPTQTIERPQK